MSILATFWRRITQLFQKKEPQRFTVDEWWLRLYPLLKMQIDAGKMQALSDEEEKRAYCYAELTALKKELRIALPKEVESELVQRWIWEAWGFGPMEPILQNPAVTDVLINKSDEVYQEVSGLLERTDCRFDDDYHLMNHLLKVFSAQGHRVDVTRPYADSKLKDGSRINVVAPPIAADSPVVSIRKFTHDKLTLDDLERSGSMPHEIRMYFEMIVGARLNVMLSGATGSGKTTMLNAMLATIPAIERLVVIEDTAELALATRHAVRLLTRTESLMGTNAVTQRELLKNALRMRPDRILVGEVRGDEVMEMFQAMNTGHDGSLATIHASYVEEVPTRLANLASMTELSLTTEFIMKQVASALEVIIQIGRYRDGSRRVAQVSEVVGMKNGVLQFADVYRLSYDKTQDDWLPHYQPKVIQEKTIIKARERGVSGAIIEEVLHG